MHHKRGTTESPQKCQPEKECKRTYIRSYMLLLVILRNFLSEQFMSTRLDWWCSLEEREVNFITEDKPGIEKYLDYGLEHLALENLRTHGLQKVLKIRENIVELREPLNPSTISVDVIASLLGAYPGFVTRVDNSGDKFKVPVVEAISQQEVGSKSMKEWRGYCNADPSDRDQIVCIFICDVIFLVKRHLFGIFKYKIS